MARLSQEQCTVRQSIPLKRTRPGYFQTCGDRFMVGGDFNAKHNSWGSRLINPKGQKLQNVMVKNGCEYISTGTSTY